MAIASDADPIATAEENRERCKYEDGALVHKMKPLSYYDAANPRSGFKNFGSRSVFNHQPKKKGAGPAFAQSATARERERRSLASDYFVIVTFTVSTRASS